MTVDVKICGIKTPEALEAALDAGAAYIGFVFFPKSPRHISLEEAANLVAQTKGRAKSVALLVNPSDDEINGIVETVDPDIIQLHGNESPSRVLQIKALANRPILKAIGIATAEDSKTAEQYDELADMILFDAKPTDTKQAELPGGNGIAFDWQLIADLGETRQFMLSGGLNPDNVQEAIERTGAKAVDVSSGVEISKGNKDPELIRRFIIAAHKERK